MKNKLTIYNNGVVAKLHNRRVAVVKHANDNGFGVELVYFDPNNPGLPRARSIPHEKDDRIICTRFDLTTDGAMALFACLYEILINQSVDIDKETNDLINQNFWDILLKGDDH